MILKSSLTLTLTSFLKSCQSIAPTAAAFSSACCQSKVPKASTLATERPDLDFDFLLATENLQRIEKNICNRKGVGDIRKVHQIWKSIQEFSIQQDSSMDAQMEEYDRLWTELYNEALLIPNLSHPEAPIGDETKCEIVGSNNITISRTKHRTAENIAQSWKSILYPRRAAGGKSYTLLGPAANLQQALFAFVKNAVRNKGFHEVSVSDILPTIVTQACGMNLRENNGHPMQYLLTDFPKMCLSGTAEMGIAQTLQNRTFKEHELPLFLMAESRCYRPEISKSAVEAKLYRVHEFNKLEMFAVCTPTQSDKVLDEFVAIQTKIWKQLQIQFRVLNMSTEELGASAARKFDVEAFMPGRNLFGEVSSASNCTDYQARRLGIRYVAADGSHQYVHTCNGTALASTRAIIALLETHQTNAGFDAPAVLKSYLPKERSKERLRITYC